MKNGVTAKPRLRQRVHLGALAVAALICPAASALAQQPAQSSMSGSSPARTTNVDSAGRTLASSRLATDILNRIAGHVRTTQGCETLSRVDMEVMPRSYVPVQPALPAGARGGHFERWRVAACGRSQSFQVGMWPSQRGGSDFAVTPLGAAPAAVAGRPAVPPSAGDPSGAGLSSWHGRYVWEEQLGRIGGSSPSEGVAAFITYNLVLGPAAGATGCKLDGDGYQTHRRLLCTATPQGRSLVVKFYKFGPGNALGRHQIGERLMTLTRSPVGLMTQLEGLEPAIDGSPRSGMFFRPAR